MKRTKQQKRREAKARRAENVLEGGKGIASPQTSATAMPPIQSSHKDEANNHAQQAANNKTSPKDRSRRGRMSGAVLAISALVCCICLAIAAVYWGRGGYGNVKVGFYWLVPTATAFVVAALSAYWYYVVRPESTKPGERQEANERPIVFIKHIALDGPLSAEKEPIVMFVIANSGSMEAEVKLWDVSSYFEPVNRIGGPLAMYSKTAEQNFTLAPTGEAVARLRFPNLGLTAHEVEQINGGRAHLYFFARGQYQDERGRVWDFPFCRIYDFTFPGNVMNCPSTFKIGDATKQPYITVIRISLTDVEIGKHPRYEVVWKNSGEAEAIKSSTWAFIALMDGPIGDSPEYPKLTTTASVVDAGVGEQRAANHRANFAFTKSNIEGIQRGKIWLYIYGWIDYSGPDGIPHKKRFCSQYIPGRPDLIFCPKHNESD